MPSFKTKDGRTVTFTSKTEQKPTGILGYQTKGANDAQGTDKKA